MAVNDPTQPQPPVQQPQGEGYMPTLPTQQPYQPYEGYGQDQQFVNRAQDPYSSLYGINAQAAAPQVRAAQERVSGYDREAAVRNRTAPPENPSQALDMQFYGAEDARQEQQHYLTESTNLLEQARQGSQQAHQASQERNEGLQREGLADRKAEQQMVREQNLQMMQQRQATLQHMFGMLRRGGEGSLGSFMSPLGSEMGRTYDMGRFNPMESGQYYSQMMGTPDQSSGYYGQMSNLWGSVQVQQPDYAPWMDPESMRDQWYLPNATTSQNTIPTAQSGVPQQQQPQQQQQQGNQWELLNQFIGGYNDSMGY